ncbi:MAG: hypothetical protein QM775_27660 [Pirellulales bacterium]
MAPMIPTLIFFTLWYGAIGSMYALTCRLVWSGEQSPDALLVPTILVVGSYAIFTVCFSMEIPAIRSRIGHILR